MNLIAMSLNNRQVAATCALPAKPAPRPIGPFFAELHPTPTPRP
ncbi:hypothetical protein O1L60_24830 [Streptomyces diastatochromogenes]|nr:hypothetical protein [Streptomyces diastatochromogenes]